MAGKSDGYIKLYRSIQDHWIWQDKPFSKGQAWIDLILLANHKHSDYYLPMDDHHIEIQRGQLITNLSELARRWGWSRGKVDRFLKLLESDNMVILHRFYKNEQATGTQRTPDYEKTGSKRAWSRMVVSIVNYSGWQALDSDAQTADKHPTDTRLNPEGRKTEPLLITRNKKQEIKNIYSSGGPELSGKPEDRFFQEPLTNETGKPEETKSSDGENTSKESIPYQEIIDYLNEQTGRSFKAAPQATRRKIHARWEEGFRLEDFKTVIDHKVADWAEDPNYSRYLRPETLFGTKFESYLNETPKSPSKPTYSQDFADSWEAYS